MHKQIIVILSLILVSVLSVSVCATMASGGVADMGDVTRDGSANGELVRNADNPVDGSGPVGDTGAMYEDTTDGTGGRWMGIIIALLIAAALIGAVAFVLPRRRR